MIPYEKSLIHPSTAQPGGGVVVSKGGGVCLKGFMPRKRKTISLAEAYMAHIKLSYSAGGSSVVSATKVRHRKMKQNSLVR